MVQRSDLSVWQGLVCWRRHRLQEVGVRQIFSSHNRGVVGPFRDWTRSTIWVASATSHTSVTRPTLTRVTWGSDRWQIWWDKYQIGKVICGYGGGQSSAVATTRGGPLMRPVQAICRTQPTHVWRSVDRVLSPPLLVGVARANRSARTRRRSA